jgi:hypothetical protein
MGGTTAGSVKKEGGLHSLLGPRESVNLPADPGFESLDIEPEAGQSEDDESVDYAVDIENVDSGDVMIEADEIDAEGEDVGLDTDTDESEDEVSETPDVAKKKKRGMMGKSRALIGKSVKATVGAAKLGVKTTKLTGKVS